MILTRVVFPPQLFQTKAVIFHQASFRLKSLNIFLFSSYQKLIFCNSITQDL